MKNRLKSAFEPICAEESLKEETLRRLREKVKANTKPRRYFAVKQFTALVSCLVLFVIFGVFSFNIYFEAAAYIDLDINPSLALTINRFDRVIGMDAYNEEAAELLENLSLRHKKLESAVDEIIAVNSDALLRERLVTVTVQAVSVNEEALLSSVQSCVNASMSHHAETRVDVYTVDSEMRNAAQNHHISPAKYLAILELQEVDPTVTIDECSGNSLGEIHRMIEEHGGGHGAEYGHENGAQNGGTGGNVHSDESSAHDNDSSTENVQTQDSTPAKNPDNSNHSNKGKHHGNGHD